MLVREFDFSLPPELIADCPPSRRDGSRLMLLDRHSGSIDEGMFSEIADQLSATDLLVMNDTRVIPARLHGRKPTGGAVEIFLLRPEGGESDRWNCLMRPARGLRPGLRIDLPAGMQAHVLGRRDVESWQVEFSGSEPFVEWLEREGQMPLPPYIKRPAGAVDRERYQTVFARSSGAVAAPTAGLHFTTKLLDELARKLPIAYLTLHTGLGTFQPVRVDRVEDHRIHTERFSISEATADAVNATRKCGGRVIAVGTTTARTLEYAADVEGMIKPGSGEADIFIYPGYRFKVVDALITNFHLPESTLLMLVSAFAGKEFVFRAYDEAIRRGFRFYSYGDAMLIR